jgi:hypothetical protein
MSMSEFVPVDVPASPAGASASPIVIGLVEGWQFAGAQAAIPALADYFDYDDWLDRQEGLQIGLDMAGFAATIVRVDLASFLEWRILIDASADEATLDDFAAVALAMRAGAVAKVLATISEADFEEHATALDAVVAGRDYARWSRYRRSAAVKSEMLGGRVERLGVRIDDFLDWCACVGEAPREASLDHYALLTLERLTARPQG